MLCGRWRVSEVCWARVAVHSPTPQHNNPAVAQSLHIQICGSSLRKVLSPLQRCTTTALIAMKIQSACTLLALCLGLLPLAAVAQSDTTGQKLSHAPGEGPANCLVPKLHNCKVELFGLSILWTAGSCCLATLLPPRQTKLVLTHYSLLMQGTRWDPMLLVSWRLGREGVSNGASGVGISAAANEAREGVSNIAL